MFLEGSDMKDEYTLETYKDPPQRPDKIRALVCDTAKIASDLNDSGELPADKIAYGILEGVGGARFTDIEFNFDFALPRYQDKKLRKLFVKALDDWSLHISGSNVDLVNMRIDCLKAGLPE